MSFVNSKRNIITAIIVGGLSLVVAVVLVIKAAPQQPQDAITYQPLSVTDKSDAKDNVIVEVTTVADIWQKDRFNTKSDTHETPAEVKLFERSLESVIDPDYLYAVLQDVELDANGDVVINHKALQALELTVNRGRLQLNAVELAELQELIQIGLPGKAGVQTARIVGDYYNYLGAKEEMGELQLALEKPTFDGWRAEYQQLIELREMYLGADVSTALFAQHDASADYMFTVMALDRTETYSETEKQALREQAAEKLLAKLAGIDNWQPRYQRYKQERDALQASSDTPLNEQEKDALLAEHFTVAEIEQLLHQNLDRML